MHNPRQSAYRTSQSTETILLHVRFHCDIAAALDNNCHEFLVTLGLSVVFDVNDHQIHVLLHILEDTLGITSTAVSWIRSYLSDRHMCVESGDLKSGKKATAIGVSQVSVLEPMLHCMFTKPIGKLCRRHNMSYFCYADDTQVYKVFKPLDGKKIINLLEC